MSANYPGDAVAKAAFDVMMRRGWGVVKIGDLWLPGLPSMELIEPLRKMRWSEPFTALVEADKWMTEHEKG
jgi:hypothetical protein